MSHRDIKTEYKYYLYPGIPETTKRASALDYSAEAADRGLANVKERWAHLGSFVVKVTTTYELWKEQPPRSK